MSIIQNPIAPVNPVGDALVALDRWLIERGYDAAARVDVKTHVRQTGGVVGAAAIRPDDLVVVEAVWSVACSFAASTVEPPAAARVEFATFEPMLLEQYGRNLRAPSTLRGIKHAVGVLKDLGVEYVDQIDVHLIARVVGSRDPNLSRQTVRGLLRYLSAIAKHAVDFGMLSTSPFSRRPVRSWVRPSAPKAGPRHLNKAQIRAILDLATEDVATREGFPRWRAQRLRTLVFLVFYTGLRKGEALFLKCSDIDFQESTISIVDRSEHRCKTEASADIIILPDPLRPVLADWIDNHRLDAPPALLRPQNDWVFTNIMRPTPWTGGSAGVKPLDRFKALAKRAGIPAELASFQVARRSLATALEACASPSLIQRQLRHTSVATSERYYRMRDLGLMRDAFKGFDY